MAIHVHQYNMSMNTKVARQFPKGEGTSGSYLGTRQLGVNQPRCSYWEANVKVAQA